MVFKLNEKTIRQIQSSNEIREIKLSLVDFIYLVPLPPKPLLHGSQCKGLADINHFRLHKQHPPFREYLVSIANNISGIPKCRQISIRQSNCCIEISISQGPRLKIQSNLYVRPRAHLSIYGSILWFWGKWWRRLINSPVDTNWKDKLYRAADTLGLLPHMAFTGCAAGQGMVFDFSVLHRVYNFVLVCPKQGI